MKNKSNLAARDQAVLWHPFTQMKTAAPPIPIVSGKGALLFDEAGNTYIDAVASWWMNAHGHANPYIAEKLYKQALKLEHVIFADFTHQPAVELGERLLSHLPENQARVFYSDNGSTSVEVGLKMCFQYWHNLGKQKTRVIAFEHAYHGDTFGAMSVGSRNAFSDPFSPFLFDVEFIPPPIPGQETESIEALSALLKKGDVAGFIFEPLIMGAGGMLMYAPEALDQLLRMCREAGALNIADEVMVGFYKTGKFFAADYMEEKADIFCLSKGLTGGTMALGATTCSAEVFEAFYADDKLKTFFHGHSCTGNPLACSVSLASLDLFERPEFKTDLTRIMKRHEQFGQTIIDHPFVSNLRQQGIILAFDIETGKQTSYFNSVRDEIWNYFISRKLLLRPLGNTIYILPPFCITDEQLTTVYDGIRDFLHYFEKQNQ